MLGKNSRSAYLQARVGVQDHLAAARRYTYALMSDPSYLPASGQLRYIAPPESMPPKTARRDGISERHIPARRSDELAGVNNVELGT